MKPEMSVSSNQRAIAGRWLWVLGVATIVFGARLREVQLHSGPTPVLDQWDAEGLEILVPWLQGKLSLSAFFAPHNEHVHLWTRLLAWCQAAWLGRWDPQLQATFNAALHAGFAGAFAGWLRRRLPFWPAMALSVLVVVLASLPFSWENSTWGFQAHTPLALLFVFFHIRGSFEYAPGTAAWWRAQAAGLAALFTYGSMWAAPAAVLLTAIWTAAPGRRRWIPAVVLTVSGIALLLVARGRQDPAATLSLGAHSPREFLAAFLLQLGWPAAWPGACLVMGFPAFLLALQLRRRPEANALDRIVVALAVWATAQSAAYAYARGGGYIGFVSRYGDLLALGVAANVIALWRLAQNCRAWRILPAAVFAGVWLVVLAQGLQMISTRGHTEYFHERSSHWAQVRREAVTQYLTTHDATVLTSPEVRAVLYPNPQVVARVLNQPGLVKLLPRALRPNAAQARGDFWSAIAAEIRSLSVALVCSGGIILLLGVWLSCRKIQPTSPALIWVAHPVQSRLLFLLAAVAAGLVLLWPRPLEFSAEKRRRELLAPASAVKDLSFRITSGPSPASGSVNGGAALWPDALRAHFCGTLIGSAGFTGTVESSTFGLTSPWLIIPFAGFPVSAGNGLYLRIEDASGNTLKEFVFTGTNPAELDFWTLDVREFKGLSARVVLYDGRADTESWVAVAAPQRTSDPEQAAVNRLERAEEPTRFGQNSLALMAIASALAGTISLIHVRRSPKVPT